MFSKFERMVAYRYLRSSRQEGFISVIAWFSLIGIALGVATLIIVMSVMNGFRAELLERIIGMNGHVSITSTAFPSRIVDYDALTDKIRRIPGITMAIPDIDRQGLAMYKAQARGIQIHGIKIEDLKNRAFIVDNIVEGSLDDFGTIETEEGPVDTISIGVKLAQNLGIHVGSRIGVMNPEGSSTAFGTLPKQKSFLVTSIFKSGVLQFDQAFVYMPLAVAQRFFQLPDAITNIEVFVDNPDHVDKRSWEIKNTIGDRYRILNWKNQNNSLFQALEVEQNVMFIILTLIILIAGFNILSSLIMLVKDKNRDIAIMRTMGATQQNILKIFFLTGASIGTVGTLFGVVFGLVFTSNIEHIRQLLQSLSGTKLFDEEIYFLAQLPSKVEPLEVVTIVIVALLLTFISTIYPSWRAAKLDPVEALRQ